MKTFLKGITPLAAVLALLVLAPAPAGAQPACTDISDQCLTTLPENCTDAIGSEVTIQIGGLGAEDSNGDGGTCVGTAATALLTFKKSAADQYMVTVENATCGDNGSLTGFFHNITDTVAGLIPIYVSATAGSLDTPWQVNYEQTTPTDGDNNNGPKADGFGHFDAVIFNGGSTAPQGGDKRDITPGEIFVFTLGVNPGYNLCDVLTEISTPTPGERNRVAAGRWQACGPMEANSAFIGPCTGDTPLLAVIRTFNLTPDSHRVDVDWSTSLEVDNAGFNVLRRERRGGGDWVYVNDGLIPGAGDSVSGADYSFTDLTAVNGVAYQYRIEDIEFSGKNGLSLVRDAVANPQSPAVRLQTPAYGAGVSLERGLALGFENVRLLNGGSGVLQISPDPAFPAGATSTTRVPLRLGAGDVTLNPRTLRELDDLSAASGVLYWRVADRDLNPVSDTFVMEVSR